MTTDSRVGETTTNKNGSLMTIISYLNSNNIVVEFEDGYRKKTSYGNFKKGVLKNPYDKTVCGIGYMGEGSYSSSNNKRAYATWSAMLLRCSEKGEKIKPSYVECSISEEWLNFQNFAKWYEENYYELSDEKVVLDKDILVKGNKIYGEDTCVFAPQHINNLFVRKDSSKSPCPLGVSREKGYYIAQISINGKVLKLGYFKSDEEAFLCYKKAKEDLIKKNANNYKNKIPNKLYQALLDYEVESTD